MAETSLKGDNMKPDTCAAIVIGVVLIIWLGSLAVGIGAGRSMVSQHLGKPRSSLYWAIPGLPAVLLSVTWIHLVFQGGASKTAPWWADVAFVALILAGALAEAKLACRSFGYGLLVILGAIGQIFCAVLLVAIPLFGFFFFGLFLLMLLPLPVSSVPLYALFRWANSYSRPLFLTKRAQNVSDR